MTSPSAPDDRQKFKIITSNPKILWAAALALGLVLVFVFFSHRGLFQIYRFRKEKVHLEQEIAKLTAENDRLARTIDRLQHDPEMVQDLIRRELNFVKKNELIFQLPPETGAKPNLQPSSPKAGPAAESPTKPGSPGKERMRTPGKAALEGAAPKRGGLREGEPAIPGETAAGSKPRSVSEPR